jgi:multidrug efflux pump subunit AcrA (membrane-fusion protein)
MSNMRRIFIASLFLLVLVMGCQSAQEQATPTPIPTPIVAEKPTYTVQRGTVQNIFQFSGRVSPTKEEQLAFKSAGFVKNVYFERSAAIKKGDLIAELDIEGLTNQLAQAQIALDKAQVSLQEAQQANQRQIAQGKINLEIKKIRLDKAREQDPSLNTKIVKLRLDEAAVAVQLAQAAYDRVKSQPGIEATSTARNLQSATTSYEIAKTNYDIAVQAEKAYQYDLDAMQKDYDLSVLQQSWLEEGVDPNLVKAVDQARLTVERSQSQIDATQIIAPFDGVINNISITKGRQVTAFQVVVVVADPSQGEITAQLSDTDMTNLKQGMPVTVTLSSFPNKPLPGKISKLPYPYSGGGTVPKLDNADTSTHITLDDTSIKLTSGDSIKAAVLLEKADNTLWLPPAAVRTFEGRNFVVVQAENNRQRRIDIKVGIKGQERIEVLEGLEEGQIVISQ